MMKQLFAMALSVFLTAGVQAQSDLPFNVEAITSFDEPWALAFLPDGRMLVTEKKGNLLIISQDGEKSRSVGGIPDVDYGGQGGLGDVALHPDFAENGLIYLSYAEAGAGRTRGAAVMRAVLNQTERGGNLSGAEVIWRQYPKVVGRGHYGHRMMFDADGYLWYEGRADESGRSGDEDLHRLTSLRSKTLLNSMSMGMSLVLMVPLKNSGGWGT